VSTRFLPLLLPAALWFTGCGSGPKTWQVDPLLKVFPDDSVGKNATGEARLIARNGHASVQIAIRSGGAVADLAPSVEIQAPLTAQIRHAGYVPVGSNPPNTPYEEVIREAPALYPDPLYEHEKFDLKPDRTEAVWVTVYAPPNAAPGDYSGRVNLRSGGGAAASSSFNVRVTRATVPAERTLKVTNWFWLDEPGMRRHFKLGQDPEAYWRLIGNIARVLAEHRQNVILTPVFSQVDTSIQGGQIRYGFAKFDRWVETFRTAGVVGTIEGGHLLGRASGYHTSMVVPAYVIENGAVVQKNLEPDDPRAEQFFNSFLGALYAHLKEKGWTGNYIQHIHDEPHDREAAVYNRYAKIVRKNLPGIPTIDAVGLDQDIGFFADVCDIWVPVLGSFDNQLDSIAAHVAKGGQGWFYTCIGPQGRHLNRFIDYPLLKVRLLHWFNFRHNLTGFLHWGGNYWGPKPLVNVQPVINDNRTLLPAGDAAIVYPDPEKESVLSSLRLETMREGIEDYELLAALAKRNPDKAARLARTAIPHISDYVREVRQFRALERELLEE
jgi:hypothetical protein